MLSRAFLRANFRWLCAGFLMTFASSFGQTFFIALFSGELRAAFDLSHGAFGGIYALGTISSAATLIWLGRAADLPRLLPVACTVLVAFSAVQMLMGTVAGALMLLPAIYGLRLLGQGMLSHIAMTAMGRWFDRERGRSLSVAALGYTVGEAVLPIAAVFLIGWIGWRQTWFAASAVTVFVLLPLIWICLRREPEIASSDDDSRSGDTADRRDQGETVEWPAPSHQVSVTENADLPSATADPVMRRQGKRGWTRAEVLRDPVFYILSVCVMAPSFIVTGLFFNQVYLAEIKDWPLGLVATGFTLYAAIQTAAALLAGVAIDRFSAVRLLPFYLLPLGCAMLLVAFAGGYWSLFAMMALVGITAAFGATILGAIWAELYGTRHLGSIRALATACMVLASAASPGLMGILLDTGVPLETQAIGMSGYTLVASATLLYLQPRLRTLAAG